MERERNPRELVWSQMPVGLGRYADGVVFSRNNGQLSLRLETLWRDVMILKWPVAVALLSNMTSNNRWTNFPTAYNAARLRDMRRMRANRG